MSREPRWIAAEEVIRLNELQVAATGEPHLVLNPGALEGAVARPQNLFAYDENADALDMALALLFGLAQNHPFQQGNKRTAFAACVEFMWRNGYMLDLPDSPDIADRFVDAIAGRLSLDQFRSVLEPFVRAL